MYKQLRIRAYLRSGVISDQYLPLDGILYYQLVREKMGEQILTRPGESNIREGTGLYLPLKLAGDRDDGTWFYNCSFAQWSDDMIEDDSFKVKKLDFVEYKNYLNENRVVYSSRGKFKAYHIKVYYRISSYVEWYCIGNVVEIAKLLKFCTHIGKNSGDGWGEIRKWEIVDWQEDWSIRGPGNKLMRAVPWRKSNCSYGLRPSYWNERHIFPCKMP